MLESLAVFQIALGHSHDRILQPSLW